VIVKNSMDSRTFNKFRQIVYEKSGISLGINKEALVCARVSKRMRVLGIRDYKPYLQYVMEDKSGTELVHLIDAISTNVTSFFRGPDHFDFLDKVVLEWIAQDQRRFRFWSAACSSGEEPYSLAMTLLETIRGYNANVKILATDISTRMLNTCLSGTYNQEKVKTVPLDLRVRYFEQHRNGDDTFYTIKGEVKRLIVFNRLNLATPPFLMRGPFDVILCRNVMIYFDNDVKKALLAEMYRLLKPGGYLLIGHTESLTSITSNFKPIRPSIYMK
jgi:chemotaxis protein methyltransferase CheR